MTGRGQSKATRGKSIRRFGKSQVLTPQSPVTPPCTLSIPQPLSPSPNSLSPPPFESQTLAVTSATTTSAATTSATTATTSTATADIDTCRDEASIQKRGPRGAYLNKNIPKDPSERTLIHIIGPSHYLEACAAISITKDFKSHFHGTQTQWSLLDDDFVDILYQCFLDRYQYEASVDLKEARKVWVARSMDRCRGTWAMVRKKCESKSQSDNPGDWKNFRPEFVNMESDWDVILDSCMKEEWQRRSRAGAENRKKVPGDLEGTSSYVRHTGGSKSFGAHCYEEEKKTGKRASKVHMFEILHKKNKGKGDWCDTRSEKVVTTYNESVKVADGGVDLVAGVDGGVDGVIAGANGVDAGSPADVPFNPKAWEKAIGNPKKKNFYGHGITQDPKKMPDQGTSSNSTPVNNEAIIEAQVIARVHSQLQDARAEIRIEMMEEMKKMLKEQQNANASSQ